MQMNRAISKLRSVAAVGEQENELFQCLFAFLRPNYKKEEEKSKGYEARLSRTCAWLP